MGKQAKAPARQTRGRDVGAPERHMTINGQEYVLRFTNATIRTAEDVYEQHYGRDVGFSVILQELAKKKYAAIMALYYGALLAGGAKIDWATFDTQFTVTSVEGMAEMIQAAIVSALPDAGDTDTPT